ncbi:MAG: hypothetical protein P4L84_09805 [Isosphaeraceae bacterium]|nr:hypothetical protein [Isosphaeraceae bacterium]
MNRRTALFFTMLLGGLMPRGLLAQTAGKRGSRSLEPAKSRRESRVALEDTPDEPAGDPAPDEPADEGPAAVSGLRWKRWDISRYTAIPASSATNPQTAIIDWIFRRTSVATWHGDKPAVLSASRAELRAYHDAETLKKVDDVVERFIKAYENVLSIRVRVVAAVDTRWRYTVYSQLTPVNSGPQGQQIWTLKREDAAIVLAQMQINQGFRLLVNRTESMVNGQTLKIETTLSRGYNAGMQRESSAGAGVQPKVEQLEEGVWLRLSPLLSFEGDTLDAAIELTANTVKHLHRTRVIAPRQIGPNEMTVDVPECVETRLNQTVLGWPLGQTLLISAGIHPGILENKNGFLNMRIPGTYPTSTELLVFLEAETAQRAKKPKE